MFGVLLTQLAVCLRCSERPLENVDRGCIELGVLTYELGSVDLNEAGRYPNTRRSRGSSGAR